MATKKTAVKSENITKYRKNTKSGGNSYSGRNSSSKKSVSKKNTASEEKNLQLKKRKEYVQEEESKKGLGLVTAAILGVLAAIVLELCNLNVFGQFGGWIKYGLFGLFGSMGYIFPLIVLFVFIISTFEEKKSRILASVIIAFIFLCSFSHLVSGISLNNHNVLSYFTACAESLSGGGIIGGAIALCLYMLLSQTGAVIITVIVIIVCLFFIFEEPIKNIFDSFFPSEKYEDSEETDIYDNDYIEDRHKEKAVVKKTSHKAAPVIEQEKNITEFPKQITRKNRQTKPSRYYDETIYETYDDDGRVVRIVRAKKRKGRLHTTPMTRTENKAQPLRNSSVDIIRSGNKVRGISSELDMIPHNANGDEIHEITARRKVNKDHTYNRSYDPGTGQSLNSGEENNTERYIRKPVSATGNTSHSVNSDSRIKNREEYTPGRKESAYTVNTRISGKNNSASSLIRGKDSYAGNPDSINSASYIDDQDTAETNNIGQREYEQLSFNEEELMKTNETDETDGFVLHGVFNRPEAAVTSVSQAAVNRRSREARPVKVRQTEITDQKQPSYSGRASLSAESADLKQSFYNNKAPLSADLSDQHQPSDRRNSEPADNIQHSANSQRAFSAENRGAAASGRSAAERTANVVPAAIKLKNGSDAQFFLPPMDLLEEVKSKNATPEAELEKIARDLEIILNQFGVHVTVTDIQAGPSVTRFELQPELGTRVNKITSLADDLKLNLGVTEIRIEAPIPGRQAVGIEIPNKNRQTVYMRELLQEPQLINHPSKIAFAAGKDISGNVIVADIAKMPHLLVAGTTGSGKSVFLNTILMTILYRATPAEVGLIIIDPKKVEFGVYAGIPHLMREVVTDPGQAVSTLRWAVNEMTNRYQRMQMSSVRDFKSYNAKVEKGTVNSAEENPKKMNQIVIIIDELADLMMVAKKEAESLICRLAQLARAAGIHLIIATQRPSVDVVTGLIKANVPARVALLVSSQIDSRTIIDMQGAEKLLGNGDMLFYPTGYVKPVRIQGAFVSDDEIQNTVDYLIDNNSVDYFADEAKEIEKFVSSSSSDSSESSGSSNDSDNGNRYDEYFLEAGKLCIEMGKASSSMLQRRFNLGFNRAARIIDQLQEFGVVGPQNGAKPRQILVDTNTFLEMYENMNNK